MLVRRSGPVAGRLLRNLTIPPTSSAPPKATVRRSWLTSKVLSSPAAMRIFLGVTKVLGYNSEKQVAGQRVWHLYHELCAPRASEDADFWKHACHLPPTLQSWFTITNLHVWLLTTRFRALPPSKGNHYIQALLDYFFMDLEERMRLNLQPRTAPHAHSQYYTPSAMEEGVGEARKGISNVFVTRQMKIFKEQWAGMGIALDLGVVKGDMELAAAVWRNLLGARGARGIPYGTNKTSSSPGFRRSINLVGGSDAAIKHVEKAGLEAEEHRDDRSGVHDFTAEEVDNYVAYPQTIVAIVEYLRSELVRLESVEDQVLEGGPITTLRFRRLTKAGLDQDL